MCESEYSKPVARTPGQGLDELCGGGVHPILTRQLKSLCIINMGPSLNKGASKSRVEIPLKPAAASLKEVVVGIRAFALIKPPPSGGGIPTVSV